MKTYRDFSEIKGAHPLGTIVKILLPQEQEWVLYADGWHKRTFETEQTMGGGSDNQFGYFEFDGDLTGKTVVDIPVNDKSVRYVKMGEFPISFPDAVGVTFYGGKETDPIKYVKTEVDDIVYYGGGRFPDIVCIKQGSFANVTIPEDGVYIRYEPNWYISKCELYEIDTPKCWQIEHRETTIVSWIDPFTPKEWMDGDGFEFPRFDYDEHTVFQVEIGIPVGEGSEFLNEAVTMYAQGGGFFGNGKEVRLALNEMGDSFYFQIVEINPKYTIDHTRFPVVREGMTAENHRELVPIKNLDLYEQGRIYEDSIYFNLGNNDITRTEAPLTKCEVLFVGDEVFVNAEQGDSDGICTMTVPVDFFPLIIQKKLTTIYNYYSHTGYKWRDSEKEVPDNYCAVWSNRDGTVDIECKCTAGNVLRERLEFYVRMDN